MNIIQAMSYEDNLVKRYFLSLILLNIFLVVIAISSNLLIGPLLVGILGCLVIITRVFSFLASEAQVNHAQIAAKLRRMALLKDGLNIDPDEIELMSVRALIGQVNDYKPAYTPPYYASKLPPGERRLADISAESAFFTHNLARTAAQWSGLFTIVGCVAVVATVYLLLTLGLTVQVQVALAKIIAVVALFFTTGDFALLWKKYSRLSVDSERALGKYQTLFRKNVIPQYEIRVVLEEYICTISHAPPIPSIIYNTKKDKLNHIWRDHRFSDTEVKPQI